MATPRRSDRDGLYQRQGSPFWWATWTGPDGRRARRSTRTTDRREAEAILAGWRLAARQAPGASAPRYTFDALMLDYLQGPSQDKRSDRDHYSAKPLYANFTGGDLSTLSAVRVRGYIDARRLDGAAPGTINRELGLLSAAWNWASREWGWDLPPNPTTGRRLREPEGRVRWLTREEADRLLAAAAAEPKAEHLVDFIRLALHTGCRRDELLGLEWSRVDMEAGLLLLEAAHTKAGRRRSVPLNRSARLALLSRLAFRESHCPGSAWVFAHADGSRLQQTRRSFMSACRRAGIADFRIHDLRHTCAAWLVSAGVPLTEVRDLLGHSTIAMTERYAHLAPERVRAAVAAIEDITAPVLKVIDHAR